MVLVRSIARAEFEFEKNVGNVRLAAADMRIEYPIAVDYAHAVWRAFSNAYWPALYFIDAQGRVRHHRFGEGDYEKSERVIRQLLSEAGAVGVGSALVSVEGIGAEAAPDWDNLRSPENYVGYGRTENFTSPGGAVVDKRHVYTAPTRLRLNHWALAGDWTVAKEATLLNKANGRIVYRFQARDLVMGRPRERQGDRAAHVSTDPQPLPIADRQFEIEFLDPGVEAFAFTFG
jgi:hypothetical protein